VSDVSSTLLFPDEAAALNNLSIFAKVAAIQWYVSCCSYKDGNDIIGTVPLLHRRLRAILRDDKYDHATASQCGV